MFFSGRSPALRAKKQGWGTAAFFNRRQELALAVNNADLAKFKMARMLFCLVLVVLSPVAVMWAGEAVAGEAVQLHSVQADFIQEKNLKILVRPIISSGRFIFQAPENLRWEYTTPFRSVLLMHGGKIIKFTEHNGELVEERGLQLDAMQVVLGEISGWLDGRFTDNAAFTTEIKNAKIVILTPREKGMRSFISRIELKLSDQAGLLDSVTIFEGADSSTSLLFSHAVLNQPIPETLFTKP